MHKKDIECAELVRGGIKLTAKDGRTALLKFRDSERLRSASPKQRVAFRLSFGGLRWDDIDEDLSYDSIFEPQAHPLRGSAKFKSLNMSEVARRLGIQQSLMAAYMNGSKNPSAEREKLIRKEIRKIGRELLDI
jgi:hypothetical protein